MNRANGISSVFLACGFAVLLAACGGGGGDELTAPASGGGTSSLSGWWDYGEKEHSQSTYSTKYVYQTAHVGDTWFMEGIPFKVDGRDIHLTLGPILGITADLDLMRIDDNRVEGVGTILNKGKVDKTYDILFTRRAPPSGSFDLHGVVDGISYTHKSQTAYGLLSRDGQRYFSVTVIDTTPYEATKLWIAHAYLPTGISPPVDEWIEVGPASPWDGWLDLSTPTASESASSGVVMYTELTSRFRGLFDSLPLDGGGFLEGTFAVDHLATDSQPSP